MKGFVIALVVFFAAGVSIGIDGVEPMNTMPYTNNLLTKKQYERIINWGTSLENAIELREKAQRELYNKPIPTDSKEKEKHFKRVDEEYKRIEDNIEKIREKYYALIAILSDEPYRRYTDEEIIKVYWKSY